MEPVLLQRPCVPTASLSTQLMPLSTGALADTAAFWTAGAHVPVPVWSVAAPALAVPPKRQHGRGTSQPRRHAPGDVRGRQPQAQRARSVLGSALLVRRGLALAAARLAHPAALPRILRQQQARRPCPCPCYRSWPPARSIVWG